MMTEYTLLEIGSGPDFERARETAKDHPDWLVIAVDPEIKGTRQIEENLFVINKEFSPKMFKEFSQEFFQREIKVDSVDVHNCATPYRHTKGKILSPVFSWITEDDNDWLADKHEITFTDIANSGLYHTHRRMFDSHLRGFKEVVAKYGYTVQILTISKEEYAKLGYWDTTILMRLKLPRIVQVILQKD